MNIALLLTFVISILTYAVIRVKFLFEAKVWVSILAVLFMFFLPVAAIILQRINIGRSFHLIISWISYPVFAFFALFISFLIVRDLLYLFIKLLLFVFPDSHFLMKIVETPINGLVLSIVTLIFFIYGIWNAYTPTLKSVQLYTKLDSLNGLKALQLSDIHVSDLTPTSFVERIVRISNEANPEIIFLTGDLTDGNFNELRSKIEILKQLKADKGKYFITGNHEYFNEKDSILSIMEEIGFKVLQNEGEYIFKEKLYVGGINDYIAGRFKDEPSDPEKALNNYTGEGYKILLAHQPKSIKNKATMNYDLILSGHTHGGQFFPGNLLVYLDQPYIKGLYDIDGTKLYVSQGTGFWGPPIRVGTTPEITLFEFSND